MTDLDSLSHLLYTEVSMHLYTLGNIYNTHRECYHVVSTLQETQMPGGLIPGRTYIALNEGGRVKTYELFEIVFSLKYLILGNKVYTAKPKYAFPDCEVTLYQKGDRWCVLKMETLERVNKLKRHPHINASFCTGKFIKVNSSLERVDKIRLLTGLLEEYNPDDAYIKPNDDEWLEGGRLQKIWADAYNSICCKSDKWKEWFDASGILVEL